MDRPVSVLATLIALAIGCGDGTSGWVLTRNHSSPPLTVGGSAGSSSSGNGAGGLPLGGASTSAGRGGSSAGTGGNVSPEGGAAGADATGPRNPDDFAEVCSPVVTVDNRTQTGNGQLFSTALPNPVAFMVAAARRSCALLYKLPEEVPVTTDLTVLIEDFDGAGTLITGGSGSTVRLSSLYMRNIADAGGDVALEVSGVSQFLIALDYVREDEDPGAVGWLNSGLADWVRFEAGYTPLSSRGPGGTWTDGYKTTAFFIDWLDQSHVDAAYLLNQSMDASDGVAWSDQIFVEIGGSDVATLWNDYQTAL